MCERELSAHAWTVAATITKDTATAERIDLA